ncbi:MAG: GTPase domain-containing protein [Salinivirgaceae bacterium]|nr:GTPase domain-containing protein [Salinivirgaceae bacterium]
MGEQVEDIINIITGTDSTSGTGTNTNANGIGQLLFCDARSQSELNDFIDSERPKLVALVGFANYGKSTFIGTLYELLIQNLNYSGYSFVDSDTYVGFERRVFLRRNNDEDTSDTKRNVLGENDILNLMLRSNEGKFHQVLLSDRSGETYLKYTSSDDEVKDDLVIENADLLVFFVDAEADTQNLAVHNLIVEKYEGLLTRLKAQHKITASVSYIMVFTKIDKVVSDERREKLTDRKKKLSAIFTENIGKEPDQIYEVNSTDLNHDALNQVFEKIISPLTSVEAAKELDWVRMEIEKQK